MKGLESSEQEMDILSQYHQYAFMEQAAYEREDLRRLGYSKVK